MKFFSRHPLPNLDQCTVELSLSQPQKRMTKWIRKFTAFYRLFLKRFYVTGLLVKYEELRKPAAKSLCPMRWINEFPSLFFTMKLITLPAIMKAILKHPRKDPERGFFNDQENGKAFIPILCDLYPEETISVDDFLLTCHEEFIQNYRQPILQVIGSQNIKKHSGELETIVEEVLNHLTKDSPVNATEWSLIFSTTVISRLLLGHPGSFEAYKEIAYANDYINKYALKKAWKRPISKEEKAKYEQSLQTMRQAVEISLKTPEKAHLGSLVDAMLEKKKMSEIQIRGALLLMYFAGSETTASLLNYILWQLGRHPAYQEKIFDEINEKTGSLYELATQSKTLEALFIECIRLFVPAYVIYRQTAAELDLTVKDPQGKVVFQQTIPNKVGLLSAPTFAGRDPLLYKNPDTFDPDRFLNTPKLLRWLPFGEGRHACPGQWLAKAEILMFIAAFVRRYQFQSSPPYEMEQKGYMTLKSSEDVSLTLAAR